MKGECNEHFACDENGLGSVHQVALFNQRNNPDGMAARNSFGVVVGGEIKGDMMAAAVVVRGG
jgi:hypothetical protein